MLRVVDCESETESVGEDNSFKLDSSLSSESDEDFVVKPNLKNNKRADIIKDTKKKPAAHRQSRRSLYGMETIETLDTDSDSTSGNSDSSDDDNNDDDNDRLLKPLNEFEYQPRQKIQSDENMPPPNAVPPSQSQNSKRKLFNPNDWINFDDSEIIEDRIEKVTPAPYTKVIDFSPGKWLKKPQNPKVAELKNDGVFKIKTPKAKKVASKKVKNESKKIELNPHKNYGFLESLDGKDFIKGSLRHISFLFSTQHVMCFLF